MPDSGPEAGGREGWGPEVGQTQGARLWPLTILPQTLPFSLPTTSQEALPRV